LPAFGARIGRSRGAQSPAPAQKVLGLVILLAFGASSGALLGAAKAIQPWAQSEEKGGSTLYHLNLDPHAPFVAAALVLEEAVPPVLARSKPGPIVRKRVVTSRARNAAVGVTPVISAPSAPASATCDRLEDAMINWLLELVARTAASNPDLAGVAAGVQQQLQSAMGRNMCAEEAQAYVAAMCQHPSVVTFMRHMVRELPFFVRPLVGDPCKADLVAAAKKWLN
jgi:hypothetical protein